jgi:hypothetical protein
MAWSLQRIGDNPKDGDSWDVFPPVPRPSYQRNDLGEFVKMESVPQPVTPADFDMAKVQIPEADNVSRFRRFRRNAERLTACLVGGSLEGVRNV